LTVYIRPHFLLGYTRLWQHNGEGNSLKEGVLKRTFLLVPIAIVLLASAVCLSGPNKEVTPNHTITSTDVVKDQGEINRLLAGVESLQRKGGSTPTPTPLLSSPTPDPEPTMVAASVENTVPSIASSEVAAQTVEGVLLTFFDCDSGRYCGRTASGEPIREGGAACDPDYWPFGTRMTIIEDPNKLVWTCIDTGSLVVGPRHWDVWFYKWADGDEYLDLVGTTVTIQILP